MGDRTRTDVAGDMRPTTGADLADNKTPGPAAHIERGHSCQSPTHPVEHAIDQPASKSISPTDTPPPTAARTTTRKAPPTGVHTNATKPNP